MKTRCSFFISFLALLSVSTALAEGEDFGARKQRMLETFDTRINALQQSKTCISAAQDQAALNKCHQAQKEARMEMRAAHKAKRAERIDQRIKKLEAQKQELQKQ